MNFLLLSSATEPEGVDKDGDPKHRSHGEVLQRPHDQGVRHRGVGGAAHRPEDPPPKRAAGGRGGKDQSSEEDVNASAFRHYSLFCL